MRKALVLIYHNVALLCVLLFFLEAAGQLAFYLLKGYPVFRTPAQEDQKVLEAHPYLVGRLKRNARVEDKGNIVTTTAIHTRWTGAPPDSTAIRVAVVGG